jgi:hypothetical protein
VRPQPQSDPATGDRLVELAQRSIDLRQVGMIHGVVRIAGDGAPDQQGGARKVALLVGDHTQEVQCLQVPRLSRQEYLVESGRLVEATVLMMLQGKLERIGHGGIPTVFSAI